MHKNYTEIKRIPITIFVTTTKFNVIEVKNITMPTFKNKNS